MTKKLLTMILIILTILICTPILLFALNNNVLPEKSSNLSSTQVKEIEKFIKKQMDIGKIPGISVTIVKEDQMAYQKGLGFSDVSKKKQVTPDTLFELGSNSKAFTALGILQLADQGKLNLNDDVSKFLPWFTMRYYDKKLGKTVNAKITIYNLLHHTSGVPFKSIGDIPINEADSALEDTVKSLSGKELDFYPGEKFLYATINYDILGLIVQKISGQSFEEYMKFNVINKLGLNSTYLSRKDIIGKDLAVGYKVGFLTAQPYDAPVYRGNVPAGYFMSNGNDMAKWLMIQLGTINSYPFKEDIIKKSQLPDRTVVPNIDGSSYACGWTVMQKGGGEIIHGGNNPNYSSLIIFRPEEKLGIAVLANMNSEYTKVIAEGIASILLDNELVQTSTDMYKNIDNVSVSIICITCPVILMNLWLLFGIFVDILKKRRVYSGGWIKSLLGMVSLILFNAGLAYCLYKIPDVLYWELPWNFVKVWVPESLIFAILALAAMVVLFSFYFLLQTVFKKNDNKGYFIAIILSVFSGFGNAFIIFVINETLNRGREFQSGLFMYFILGIFIYAWGQKLVRTMLINITNNLVYTKRMELVDKISKTSYQNMELIESGSIQAGLNNDTETISGFANTIITGVTSVVTLLSCFVYLGIINLYGLLISILFILAAASMYFLAGKSANKLWEQTRDIQNVFFKFINDIIFGFKELTMNKNKMNEFKQDMQQSCEDYKSKRIMGDIKFTNVFVIGELLFTIVIGAVAFIFPLVFKDIQNSSLRSYIFVFLYMSGPVNGILNAIPNVVQVRISWKRINELSKQITLDEDKFKKEKIISHRERVKLKAIGIEYAYKNNKDEVFTIGPINYEFNPGEIIFITGGNGSGKSTLAKLITGLYLPDKGKFTLNGKEIDQQSLKKQYSAIFSDFYIFDKVYGIDTKEKSAEIDKYLKVLHIDDKVKINEGMFSTLKLSTGQRKRLALLISYLEDRPIYLFDEWAADQDPEYRKIFYHQLLPELKNRGKCVIAITHDDRYFDVADRILKMEMGKLVQSTNDHHNVDFVEE